MFSELDRSGVRWALGYSAIFVQADPSLEVALTAIQSLADLGSRPDSTEENFCKGVLYGFAAQAGSAGVPLGGASTTGATYAVPARRGLYTVWAAIDALDAFMGALKVDGGEAEVDSVRERRRLIAEGKRLVHALARKLSTAVVTDIFEPSKIVPGGNAVYFNRPQVAFEGYSALRRAGARGLW